MISTLTSPKERWKGGVQPALSWVLFRNAFLPPSPKGTGDLTWVFCTRGRTAAAGDSKDEYSVTVY